MTKTFIETHFTGEGFRTLAVYRRFFKAALRAALKREADFYAEVAEWYETGDGAQPHWVELGTCEVAADVPGHENYHEAAEGCIAWEFTHRANLGGLGYAFPTCIHGSSLWTDYDNICGGCEESQSAIEDAIVAGRERYLRFNDRWEWINAAPGDLRHETRQELLDWAVSLFPKTEELS